MVLKSFGHAEGVRDVVLNAFRRHHFHFWHSLNLVCRAVLGLANNAGDQSVGRVGGSIFWPFLRSSARAPTSKAVRGTVAIKGVFSN